MKPTLEQIYNFGTERVDREHYTYINDKEYLSFRPAKRYKLGVIYQVCIMYGYSTMAISNYCKISKNQVGRTISYLQNNNSNFDDDVNEMKNSLDYIYKYSIFAQKKDNLMNIYKEEKSKLSFEDWLITRL